MAALWAIIVIALLVIIICLATHKRKLRDDAYDRSGTDAGCSGPDNAAMRHFTLAELRAAPDGMYHWDEGGSVFAVNNDGSITMVVLSTPRKQILIQICMRTLCQTDLARCCRLTGLSS